MLEQTYVVTGYEIATVAGVVAFLLAWAVVQVIHVSKMQRQRNEIAVLADRRSKWLFRMLAHACTIGGVTYIGDLYTGDPDDERLWISQLRDMPAGVPVVRVPFSGETIRDRTKSRFNRN